MVSFTPVPLPLICVVTNISLVIEVNTYVQKRSWGLGYGSTSNHPHRAAILCILVALKDSRLDLNLLSESVEVRFPITMCVLVRSPIMALLWSLYSLHSSLPPAQSLGWKPRTWSDFGASPSPDSVHCGGKAMDTTHTAPPDHHTVYWGWFLKDRLSVIKGRLEWLWSTAFVKSMFILQD